VAYLEEEYSGAKFTFGTNNNTPELGKMECAIQMKDECGITKGEMYKPEVKS